MIKLLSFSDRLKLRLELGRADSRWELVDYQVRDDGLLMQVVIDKKANRLVLVQQRDCENVVEIDTKLLALDVSNEKQLSDFLEIINKEQPLALGMKVNSNGSLRKTLSRQYELAVKKFKVGPWNLFLGGHLDYFLNL